MISGPGRSPPKKNAHMLQIHKCCALTELLIMVSTTKSIRGIFLWWYNRCVSNRLFRCFHKEKIFSQLLLSAVFLIFFAVALSRDVKILSAEVALPTLHKERKVFDMFMMSVEKLVVLARMMELDPIVDHFVIGIANETLQGEKKRFHFNKG